MRVISGHSNVSEGLHCITQRGNGETELEEENKRMSEKRSIVLEGTIMNFYLRVPSKIRTL